MPDLPSNYTGSLKSSPSTESKLQRDLLKEQKILARLLEKRNQLLKMKPDDPAVIDLKIAIEETEVNISSLEHQIRQSVSMGITSPTFSAPVDFMTATSSKPEASMPVKTLMAEILELKQHYRSSGGRNAKILTEIDTLMANVSELTSNTIVSEKHIEGRVRIELLKQEKEELILQKEIQELKQQLNLDRKPEMIEEQGTGTAPALKRPHRKSNSSTKSANIDEDQMSTRSGSSSKSPSALDKMKSLLFVSDRQINEFGEFFKQEEIRQHQASLVENKLPEKDIKLQLVMEKFKDFLSICYVLKVKIKLDQASEVLVLPEIQLRMNKLNYQLLEKIELTVNLAKYSVETYAEFEFYSESNDLYGWTRFYFFTKNEQGTLNIIDGIKELSLYKPPIDESLLVPLKSSVFMNTTMIMQKSPQHEALQSEAELSSISNAYLLVKDAVNLEELFEDHSGYTVYLDGVRFMPRNVTYSQLEIQLINCEGKVSNLFNGSNKTTFDLDADCEMPLYPLNSFSLDDKHIQALDLTTFLFITVYGFCKYTRKVYRIGYTFHPLFVDSSTHEPPLTSSSRGICHLNRGLFQLPVYPVNTINFNTDYLSAKLLKNIAAKRISCMSLLLRLTSNLENDTTEFPLYANGVYNSVQCLPMEKEILMYRWLAENRSRRTFRDYLIEDRIIDGPEEDERGAAHLGQLFNSKLVLTTFDYSFGAEYDNRFGFKLSVDGCQNLPTKKFVLVIASVCPPGVIYDTSCGEAVSMNNTRCTTKIDFNSSIKSPTYKDGYGTFRLSEKFYNGENLFEKFWILFDLREMSTKEPFCKPFGWTAFQLFHKNGRYIRHGQYQLPVIEGTVTRSMLLQLYNRCKENPNKSAIHLMMDEDQIRFVEGASVFIRVCDARRETELQDFKRENADTRPLPPAKLKKYTAYTASEQLASIAPKNVSQQRFVQFMLTEIRNTIPSK